MAEEKAPENHEPLIQLNPRQWKLVKLAAVAAAVAIALAITVPLGLEALRQPRITMTDLTLAHRGCGIFTSTQDYTLAFNLVNSADADGFARVAFLIDGDTAAEDTYFVPTGGTVEKSGTVRVNDCEGHSADAAIVSVWKA